VVSDSSRVTNPSEAGEHRGMSGFDHGSEGGGEVSPPSELIMLSWVLAAKGNQ